MNPTYSSKSSIRHVSSPKRDLSNKFQGRRYLLRLINTSTASTFIFSIDKHILQVVAMDFVAINPYYADSILVGIGQRYHVVVLARPSDELIPVEDQNYWIRIKGANGCAAFEPNQADERMGIIRYNRGTKAKPTTLPYKFDLTCSDEPYESLVPVVPMTVTAREHPSNDGKPPTQASPLPKLNPPSRSRHRRQFRSRSRIPFCPSHRPARKLHALEHAERIHVAELYGPNHRPRGRLQLGHGRGGCGGGES